MTVTTTYTALPLDPSSGIDNVGYGYSVSVTGLSNGGYAIAASDAEGFADLEIHDADGNILATEDGLYAREAQVTQLSNGNILLMGEIDQDTGTLTGGLLTYDIYSPTGTLVDARTIRDADFASNPSITAAANGGFAVACSENYVYPQGYQAIVLDINGTFSNIDYNSSVIDENPSIVALKDGGFAVAWDQKDNSGTSTNGNTTLHYEVLNADGSVRRAAAVFQYAVFQGGINMDPKLLATADGGFSITYATNAFNNTSPNTTINQAFFDSQGGFVNSAQAAAAGASGASSTTLANGWIATVCVSGVDFQLSLTDPVSKAVVASNIDLPTGFSFVQSPAIAGLTNGAVTIGFIYWENDGDGYTLIPEQRTYQLQRTLTGDDGDNVLTGDMLADIIDGGGGNDTITPGATSDNSVDGGTGQDRVIFSGPRAGYVITRAGNTMTVIANDGSQNTLTNVEELSFSDINVFTPPAVRDTNGDGYSDMVLQNSNGAIHVWKMGAGGALISNTATSTTPAASWHVAGTGNFSSAADSNADILLQNDNGSLVVWEMNGAAVSSNVSLGSVNTVWKAVTTGDFNGDGNADILLQNSSTGQLDIWTMDGTTAAAKAAVGKALGTAWHAIATADFNGDGKSDIVLQNDSGQIAMWLMNGAAIASTGSVSGSTGSGWQVRGAGDFNGDGKADLVLQNAAGQVAVWTMNGAAVKAKTVVGSVAASVTVTGTGDFNGDGKADIAFQSNNGSVSEWLMSGTSVLAKQSVGANPGSAWHMVAGTGG